ncbi:N amino acid transport system protein [Aureobasidium subglaciale]|nr:N amino acid transport system protein [Aureobasidium subglaciale]
MSLPEHPDAARFGPFGGNLANMPPHYEDSISKAGSADKVGAPELEKTATLEEGEAKFKKLGWKRLTICLIVEAIALGALSVPAAFAAVGMVAGVILSVGIGILAIYTSYVVGQVKIKYPQVEHYSDAVGLMFGRVGMEVVGAMFTLHLILLSASHTLTGTIAWIRIVDNPTICALVWSVISAILLFLLAIPPTFAEFAILGYIDFASIIGAIGITIIATGIEAHDAPGGLAAVPWSAWPPEDITFQSAFLAVTNIVFAYSFAICQFSFMAELHTPKDYVKSIWALGIIEIIIYTVTGALIYAFVGTDVASPALLSGSNMVTRVAFGIALPVIFISGSINATVVGRYLVGRFFKNSPIRYTNTKQGWAVWIFILVAQIVLAWVIAEAIPFFSDLLGITSALFISGFSFYFPALFWFLLIKEGKWNANAKNIGLSVLNALCFVIGLTILGCGTYASVKDIVDSYASGSVRTPFTCSQEAYA